jgi:hypothetical protein
VHLTPVISLRIINFDANKSHIWGEADELFAFK